MDHLDLRSWEVPFLDHSGPGLGLGHTDLVGPELAGHNSCHHTALRNPDRSPHYQHIRHSHSRSRLDIDRTAGRIVVAPAHQGIDVVVGDEVLQGR